MNKTKHNGLRKVIIALIATILIACMLIVLVACNNNGNDNGNPGLSTDTDNNQNGGNQGGTGENNSSTIESELKDGQIGSAILEALFGYTVKSFTRNENKPSNSVFSGFSYGTASESYLQFGEGFKGYFYTCSESDEDFNLIYLFFYDSEANARSSLESDLEYMLEDYDFYMSSGKTVIIGTSEELWDEVQTCKMPTDKTYFGYEKICEVISEPHNEIHIEDIFDRSKDNLNEVEYLEMEIYPTVGNCYETYSVFPSSAFDAQDRAFEFANNIGTVYTDSSYILKDGGTYKTYAKMNPGMQFTLNEDSESYTLTSYYADSNVTTLVIPSQYNNKPITKIDSLYFTYLNDLKSITIPKSITEIRWNIIYSEITDVYYQGTMDDWNNIQVRNTSGGPNDKYKRLTVHCSDGDILLEYKIDIL